MFAIGNSTFGGWHTLEKLFVFGDSWSAAQFDEHGAQTRHGNPFGNPEPFGIGDTGPLWSHFLTTAYNQSFIQTYNFARGGAVLEKSLVRKDISQEAFSFQEQIVRSFRPTYASKSTPESYSWRSDTSLFALAFGVNQLAVLHKNNVATPIKRLFTSYKAQIHDLYNAGARNFLLLNVPPFDRVLHSSNSSLTKNINDYNHEIVSLQREMNENYKDVTTFVFDLHAFFVYLLKHSVAMPQTAHLRNLTGTCPMYQFGGECIASAPTGSRANTYYAIVPSTGKGLEYDHYAANCVVPVSQYFWLNQQQVTYPVHNATAAVLVDDCFHSDQKRGFCA
ncbi:MAG: hypothetical protein M1831_006988 [Alyxoria varia]|nr:MAG: hypothetical protein M1831_006988 [Alyxoria varia]